MVFGAKCCCSHHNTWHHGEVSPKLLRAVNPKELEFCDVARAKNKKRSRWVCPPCRDRIALELKCRMYEVRAEVYIIIVVISPKTRFARSDLVFFSNAIRTSSIHSNCLLLCVMLQKRVINNITVFFRRVHFWANRPAGFLVDYFLIFLNG